MKKYKFKDEQTVEIVKPFLMTLQFIFAIGCMFLCMIQNNFMLGILSILFGWQAGWAMRYEKFESEERKKMRIIEKGKPRRKTCPTCGCVFEYEVADIKHVSGLSCLSRGTDVVYCPECNERISEVGSIAVDEYGHFK